MQPGPQNAITDVPGVLVGQVERTDPPYLTGTTVVYLPGTAVAGVDVRGGAPGTRETDLLDPVNSNPGVNAIVLSGGSAYGLDTASGVMAWLEERGEGVRVGPGERDVVPIVPTAVVFDLGRGGGFTARPTGDWGRQAIEAAGNGAVAEGNHGAGAGTRVGRLKGGLGTASVRLDDGTTVGAIVVLNAVGSTVDATGRLYGDRYGLGEEYAGLRTPVEPPPDPPAGAVPGMNTVIAIVATDAPLDKAAAQRMAMVAHDGIARAVDPVHTLLDGDSVFALSTAPAEQARLSVTDRAAIARLESVFAAGARTLTRAIVSAVLAAETVETPAGRLVSYRDAYPSAFAAE
ncbi:L-aminopeptidase/D-esterase-like protein [Kribbella amoyensis]|uniref:L-aminopeptidase/D-esterase-like protein n=1 Tax=Kribbella amoyensis TaxID=996641 RepID=A0A561BZ90_9ACTN|nr:P1 family peptidase [Kribbella amoyensis]TWD84127.1 L-aminopeptidase/D-esterase-like protein [Kribbella amoyensis]